MKKGSRTCSGTWIEKGRRRDVRHTSAGSPRRVFSGGSDAFLKGKDPRVCVRRERSRSHMEGEKLVKVQMFLISVQYEHNASGRRRVDSPSLDSAGDNF